jgi:restriction system protein
MARRQASFDDLLGIGSKLPWRVAVLLAVGSFLVFHFLAIMTSPPAAGTTLGSLGTVGLHSLIHTAALFLQYLMPAGLLIGAFIGAFLLRVSAVPQVQGDRADLLRGK